MEEENVDVEIYSINDKDYALIKKITNNDNTYLYFSNVSEEDDYLIRKLDPNNKDYMIPLDSAEEVKKALYILTNNVLEN